MGRSVGRRPGKSGEAPGRIVTGSRKAPKMHMTLLGYKRAWCGLNVSDQTMMTKDWDTVTCKKCNSKRANYRQAGLEIPHERIP